MIRSHYLSMKSMDTFRTQRTCELRNVFTVLTSLTSTRLLQSRMRNAIFVLELRIASSCSVVPRHRPHVTAFANSRPDFDRAHAIAGILGVLIGVSAFDETREADGTPRRAADLNLPPPRCAPSACRLCSHLANAFPPCVLVP